MSVRSSRWALILALTLTLTACTTGPEREPSATTTPRPPIFDEVDTIAVLGDSIALGMNACGQGPCPEASWVASDDPEVESLGRRVVEAGFDIDVRILARDGASIGTALQNVDAIADAAPDLVIVALGANDACAPGLDEMTSAEVYGTLLSGLLTRIRGARPDATVLVMSVVDVNATWELKHTDHRALQAWKSSSSCDSLLGDADSTSLNAEVGRAEVASRVDEYNAQIAQVCATQPDCFIDGGALHDAPFTAADISDLDYFHPSVSGQARIAAIVWDTLMSIGEQ